MTTGDGTQDARPADGPWIPPLLGWLAGAVGVGVAMSIATVLVVTVPWWVWLALLGVTGVEAWLLRRALLRGDVEVPATPHARLVARCLVLWPLPVAWVGTMLTDDEPVDMSLLDWLHLAGTGGLVLTVFVAVGPLRESVILLAEATQRRSGRDLSRARRREITAALRAGRPMTASDDGDVRAMIHSVLDRELGGWAAAVLGVVVSGVALAGLGSWASWVTATMLVGGLLVSIVAVRELSLVFAAKRRQRRLNRDRPAPHLERGLAAPRPPGPATGR